MSSVSLLDYSFDLDMPHMYPELELEYCSSKEKSFRLQFNQYVREVVRTDLNVNSAILYSMARIVKDISIYDILTMSQKQWIDHCKSFNYPDEFFRAGIHSIKRKYCDFFMNFGDRIDSEGKIHRKRIPCASWFDSDCSKFITDRAISRILNYAWDVPHKSITFTLDEAGWDACNWDNINDFCQLVNDTVDITINQQFRKKHSKIKGKITAGIIVIPHTFSSLDPTQWHPHFNVLVSTKAIVEQSGVQIDISNIGFNLLRKNYKSLLKSRFGLYRHGNYQINVSEHDRALSDSSFVDILRYNKRAPISDSDIVEIHDTGIQFTNYKRNAKQLPDLFYKFDKFFYGIMQHLPPKNRVQIHRYGLYHQHHKYYKTYPISFNCQSELSDYEDKTWLWTGYSGRIVAYNGQYLLNNASNMDFICSNDRDNLISLIREDSGVLLQDNHVVYGNKNTEVCKILTQIAYNFRQKSPGPPGTHKDFSFFEVSA